MTDLTKNEIAILELSLNYMDREGQLSDNYSNFDVEAAKSELNFNAQQVGGVISSLVSKGLMWVDDEDSDMVWHTENGVNAIFDIIEAR